MSHLGLWLDKYSHRRTQILEHWAGVETTLSNIKKLIPEDELFRPVVDIADTSSRMCFVDGGQGFRELLGLGVYFIRALGLILSKATEGGHGELFIRDLDMNVIHYDEHTKERVDLLRDGMEYDVASRCILEHRPSILFLDGSLHVKAAKRSIKGGESEYYRKKYIRLLRLAKRQGVSLVGVSEDSKSRLLSHHLGREFGVRFPKFMTDSAILKSLSSTQTFRSCIFTPDARFRGQNFAESVVDGFQTAYLQPSPLSNPLRIDAPSWETDFEGIISAVSMLCKGSGSYGYPLPLYMAHLDARIPPTQTDWTAKQIVQYVSKRNEHMGDAMLKATRRAARPA
jgi:hypothetical protein